ncbi:MAG: hypothetical protein ACC628_11755 [Pirellulaceae bacterium]
MKLRFQLVQGLSGRLPAACQLPDGYANNMVTYIPDARIVREGGYEGGGLQRYFLPGPFTENIDAEIKHIVTEAMDALQ